MRRRPIGEAAAVQIVLRLHHQRVHLPLNGRTGQVNLWTDGWTWAEGESVQVNTWDVNNSQQEGGNVGRD